MEILEAYCVELERVIDIYEAREAYFGLPSEKRKRFTFYCPDDGCREALSPLIVGANYDKVVEEDEQYRQPYFKTHDKNKHPHLSCCKCLSTQAKKGHGGDEQRDVLGRTERAKQSNVINSFRPREFDPQADLQPDEQRKRVGEQRGEPYRTDGGISSTSRLEKFVDCWANMSAEDKQKERVSLDGAEVPYSKAVLHVTWVLPKENGKRVIYGGAKARFWPDTGPRWLFIDFMDACERFPEHNGGRSLSVELPLSRICEYRGGAVVLEKVRAGIEPGHYIRVFAWGDIRPREGKAGYTIELLSLDNLVVKAIPKANGQMVPTN